MIKLACNYYLETIELLKENRIDIDYIKMPTLGSLNKMFRSKNLWAFSRFMKKTQKIRPVMIHGFCATTQSIGSQNFTSEFDVQAARKVIKMSGVNGISVHLAGIDTSLSDRENKKIILENLRYLRENVFPFVEFFSLENADGNPFMKHNNSGVCINPVFISEIVNESGLDFLLDISHAYCSAKCMNIDYESYLKLLPLDKMVEIHINGWIETKTDIMAHTKIHEFAYESLERIMEQYKPKILTLEYGRENDRIGAGIPLMSPDGVNQAAKNDILEQITRLRKIIKIVQ